LSAAALAGAEPTVRLGIGSDSKAASELKMPNAIDWEGAPLRNISRLGGMLAGRQRGDLFGVLGLLILHDGELFAHNLEGAHDLGVAHGRGDRERLQFARAHHAQYDIGSRCGVAAADCGLRPGQRCDVTLGVLAAFRPRVLRQEFLELLCISPQGGWRHADQVGGFAENPMLRIQYAEICGLNHGLMSLPVRVVEQSEFAAAFGGS